MVEKGILEDGKSPIWGFGFERMRQDELGRGGTSQPCDGAESGSRRDGLSPFANEETEAKRDYVFEGRIDIDQ